jgi:invasion protein IalB
LVDISLAPSARALLVAIALAGPVAADPPAAYGARRAAEITFRDWRLACLGQDCVIRAWVRGADGTAVLALAAWPQGEGGYLTVDTSLGLFLPDGLRIDLGDTPARLAPWRTCDAAGCYAVAPVDAAFLAALQRERTAEVTLTLVEGVRVRLPVSLLGFTAAWEALSSRLPEPEPEAAPVPDAEPAPAPRPTPAPVTPP